MSQRSTYTLSCPRCRAVDDAELYDSVNVRHDPSLRDALMENRLNAVTCPHCGFAYRIDKPLLYSDPQRRMLIYWIPTAEADEQQGEATFRDMVSRMTQMLPGDLPTPEIHLVFTRAELVERIFLREAGLDERVIEYIKYLILLKNLEQIPPREKTLLFNAEDSTDRALCFVVQNVGNRQLETVIEYRREAYEGLCEMFDQDEQTATLLEMFPGPRISARALLLHESEVPES